MAYLKEAFQKLNLLEDVEFDIDERDSAEQLQKFLNDEDERELDNIEMIVDVDASEEDELKDSYVGSLLLYCPTCHTIHYAKKEDIVKDEENPTLVNVGEPCPNCDEVEGFEIKGEVAPYEPNKEIEDEEETEEDNNEKEEDDIEIDDDDFEIEDEEDFLERLNTKTTNNWVCEAYTNKPLKENLSKKKTNKKSMLESLIDGDLSRDDFDENENYPDLDDSDRDLLKDDIEEKVGSTLPRVRKQIKENKLEEDPIYDLKPRYDARNSFYNKAVVDTGDKGDQNKLYSYGTLVAEIKDGKPVVYGTYSQTTLRHIKDWLKQNGFKAESKAQIEKDYMTEGCKTNESMSYGELADYQNAWEEYKKKVGYVYDGDASTAYNFIDEYVKAHPEYDNDEDRDAMFVGISAIEEPVEENLKEEVQDEAYEIADYILDKIKDKDTITWNEFEDLVNDGCKELYGVDLYNEVNDNDKVTINDKEFDVNDLVNGDIRGILSYSGWSTIFEGENEGGLTTKEIEESCKENLEESKPLEENASDEYAEIIDRAKMEIDDGASDVDEAIWGAIDSYVYLDDYAILKDLFRIEDLYLENGESVSTYIMEHIFNEVYSEVSDYFAEKHENVEEDEEIEESLKSQKRTVDQIKESIKTKLDKTIKEGLEKEKDDIDAKADDKKEIAKEKEEKEIDDADADEDYEEDELDENLFDNLINKYCQRVYENVDNYKTTNGSIEDNKLMLEGILTYKSGKTTNTKFMFEKLITKDGKLKFVGLNETFSKSKKAFSLNCKMDGNKIITESLTYNYKVKVNDDKKVVYGSIKNN